MKRGPQAYFADDLKGGNEWPHTTAQHPQKGEVWVMARPLCASWHETLWNRMCMAWEVFTGRADVLRWRQQ